jgi:hypothetical protein
MGGTAALVTNMSCFAHMDSFETRPRKEPAKRNWTAQGDVSLSCDAETIRWVKDFAAG